MKQRLKLIIGLSVVAITTTVFAFYLSAHRNLLTQLRHTHISTIAGLLFLYALWFVALALVFQATIRICHKALSTKENVLLNAYSTLVNFFVPGQGGPVVRGAYLKKWHQLRVRDYVTAVLLYYACYALLSAGLILATIRPWWQTLIGLILVGAVCTFVVKWYIKRSRTKPSRLALEPSTIVFLLAVTLIQALVQVAIYSVELHSVNPQISLKQIIIYTGAANFSLFASLTPGGIGIRESFLVFSEHLNHISTANIVAASVIDRGVFIVFLAILFLMTFGFHAKNRLAIGPVNQNLNPEASD